MWGVGWGGGVVYNVLLKKMKAVIVYCDFIKKSFN